MGWWQAITSALRAARESKRGRASGGGCARSGSGLDPGRSGLGRLRPRSSFRAYDQLHSECCAPPDDVLRT